MLDVSQSFLLSTKYLIVVFDSICIPPIAIHLLTDLFRRADHSRVVSSFCKMAHTRSINTSFRQYSAELICMHRFQSNAREAQIIQAHSCTIDSSPTQSFPRTSAHSRAVDRLSCWLYSAASSYLLLRSTDRASISQRL